MIADFLAGIGYLLRGFRLIRQPGLRRFFVLPIAINFLVFTVLIWLGAAKFASITERLLPGEDAWWIGVAGIVVWILFGAVVLVLMFFLFTLVANLIGAPFNGWLAEKVERMLLAGIETEPVRKGHFLVDLFPSIIGELKKYLYFLVVAGLLFLVALIPVVNIVSPPLSLIFISWMFSLEYVSYPMGNHNRHFSQVRKWLRENRMLNMGFGLAVLVATLTPLVNFAVMPAAVAGATAMWVERRTETTSTMLE